MALLHITIGILMPMALSMQLQDASNSASDGDAPHHTMTLSVVSAKVETFAEMERVFRRSDEAHQQSMDQISQSLTLPKAMEVMEHSNFSKRITSLVVGGKSLRSANIHVADGFGGLDGARKLLNDMIYESMEKYDKEIAKCTDYYAKQCALMEVARGQISASNFIAATARALILDAQYNINKCQVSIPETKQELKDHNSVCSTQLKALNKQLKIVMGDIAIMTMILKMSDCDAKLMQTQKLQLLRCEDQCTGKKYVSFGHSELQSQVSQLHAQDQLSASFADLFDDGDSESFLQQPSEMMGPSNDTSKTKFNNPPVPKTKVPSNPCTDPNKGAPSAEDKLLQSVH
jgi:hypothetical protein